MKKARNILAVLLLIALMACSLAGCESETEKIEKLAGTWYITIDDTAEEAYDLLASWDFYEEEIALIDLDSLQYGQTVTFNTDKTYSFAGDSEDTKDCVRTFIEKAYKDMYAGRTALNVVYEQEFDSMSEEEFYQFYADLYQVSDFAALVSKIVDGAYDYKTFSEPWETGTYSIKGSKILCTVTGEITEEYLTYKIEDDALTLTYEDAVEVYSRSR